MARVDRHGGAEPEAYLSHQEDIEFLAQLPLEYRWRHGDSGRFLHRLRAERAVYGDTEVPVSGFRLAVVVFVDDAANPGLMPTVRSVALQSCPAVQCVLTSREPSGGETIAEQLRKEQSLPKDVEILAMQPESLEDLVNAFVCFVHPGDVLHPSLAHAMQLRAVPGGPDVIVWNDITVEEGPGNSRTFHFTLRPQLERHTLRHIAYIGRSFALRAELLRDYGEAWLSDVRDGHLHLLQLALAERTGVSWTLEPQLLSIQRRSARVGVRDWTPPYHSVRQRYEDYRRTHWQEFELRETTPTQPYRLIPHRKPQNMGVIIPFRDEPELTIESAMSSLRQNTPFEVSLTLVNNQSKRESVDSVRKALDQAGYGDRYDVVDYDQPFNHSAECNLGARACGAEVVVLLNNDAVLVSEDALLEMGSWAVLPDVATVGLRIEDEHGGLVCAGLELRRNLKAYLDAPAEESRDESFSHFPRETPANTFAVAAVEALKLRELGWFDARQFPNSYNDVEFCLRARAVGYTHIYLGHLVARHRKGHSRAPGDELAEKLTIQERYPQVTNWALAQLQYRQARPPSRLRKQIAGLVSRLRSNPFR